MLVISLKDCGEIIAGDGSILRELLNPRARPGTERRKKEALPIHYSLAHAKVMPGQTTKPHRLKASEVYYILEGQGMMTINNDSLKVKPDSLIYIPPHSKQYIKNTGTSILKFLCIVDPPWIPENEENSYD